MNKKLLALYGLKWNPFAPDVPVDALHVTRRVETFCWRVQQLVGEGGFALVTGAPGAGKSVTLGRGGLVRRGGVLTPVPSAWNARRIDFGEGPRPAITVPLGDVTTAWHSTGIPDIELSSPPRRAARSSRGPAATSGPSSRRGACAGRS